MNHLFTVTKSDGTQQLFEEQKLIESLKRVGASDEAIDEVVEEVQKTMTNGMSTSEIYKKAFELLRRHSVHVAVKYSIRRGMLELGPDGFPFEKFVARIFRFWGYETVTDQQILGSCVTHEMDVVAWKGDDLAMVEAKYHNEFGLKSDIKVALYVKARFDDIASNMYDYGGKKRKLTQRFLFTNTKFTDTAIKYAGCNDLKLIGWNFPSDNNLHHIIEQNGLHPITLLTTLSHQEKSDLIGRNIMTCIDLRDDKGSLSSVGVKEERTEQILQEVEVIINSSK